MNLLEWSAKAKTSQVFLCSSILKNSKFNLNMPIISVQTVSKPAIYKQFTYSVIHYRFCYTHQNQHISLLSPSHLTTSHATLSHSSLHTHIFDTVQQHSAPMALLCDKIGRIMVFPIYSLPPCPPFILSLPSQAHLLPVYYSLISSLPLPLCSYTDMRPYISIKI